MYLCCKPGFIMKRPSITFKTDPKIKAALEKMAQEDYRSLSAQIEMIVVTYLKENGVISSSEKNPN